MGTFNQPLHRFPSALLTPLNFHADHRPRSCIDSILKQ
jgi:hypothetical protein